MSGQSEGSSPTRARHAGKLLSCAGDHALALLRMEHVERADKGGLQFEAVADEETYALEHYLPEWWPSVPVPDEDIKAN